MRQNEQVSAPRGVLALEELPGRQQVSTRPPIYNYARRSRTWSCAPGEDQGRWRRMRRPQVTPAQTPRGSLVSLVTHLHERCNHARQIHSTTDQPDWAKCWRADSREGPSYIPRDAGGWTGSRSPAMVLFLFWKRWFKGNIWEKCP